MENWCCQRKEADGIRIDVALQWCSDAYSDTMLGYANSIRTIDGGTHLDGMKASLTRTLNNLGKKSKIFQENDISLSGGHVREGLTCIISVKVANPRFEGQTKIHQHIIVKILVELLNTQMLEMWGIVHLFSLLELTHFDLVKNFLEKCKIWSKNSRTRFFQIFFNICNYS
ncbi:hypothetical protein LOK49_LG05G02109 [Camellia lanceoleosa]|uniref:Uncharacterized protein n=1 Tax=Camellia lanceoleosa TaxID=1840588 RepID=A0ACC0HQ24_9ERIC|nr:hypothetical protein LOK49_LG05G02109 [Camellia lanceoleosa]